MTFRTGIASSEQGTLMKHLRTILVAVAAIFLATATIAASEALAHALLEGSDRFGAVAIGYALGALLGAASATFLGARYVALGVPVLLGALAAFNFFAFPHPWWFAPLAIAALVLGGVGGRWFGARARLTWAPKN